MANANFKVTVQKAVQFSKENADGGAALMTEGQWDTVESRSS
jgi:hypothetical protein